MIHITNLILIFCYIYRFPGDRWARSTKDNDIVLVFDGNGYIAGFQSVVPVAKTENDKYYPFSNSTYYQKGDFFGEEAYFVTAYLVDPNTICNGGRSKAEFDDEGTGNRVAFQTGPTPLSLVEAPLVQPGDSDVSIVKIF